MTAGKLPDKLPDVTRDEVVDNLIVGKRAWFKILDPDPPSKDGKKVATLGINEAVTFAGYQVLGNQTFLIVDRVLTGAGKKTKIESLGINASYVLYAGSLDIAEPE